MEKELAEIVAAAVALAGAVVAGVQRAWALALGIAAIAILAFVAAVESL